MDKLRTFHDRIIDVEVYLILDNVAHTIKDKVAEIKVRIPRHSFFVKHCSKTFEDPSILHSIAWSIKSNDIRSVDNRRLWSCRNKSGAREKAGR
jgi:hypothetical protein